MAKNLSSRNRGEQRKNTMLGVVEAWKPQRFIGSTFEEGPTAWPTYRHIWRVIKQTNEVLAKSWRGWVGDLLPGWR